MFFLISQLKFFPKCYRSTEVAINLPYSTYPKICDKSIWVSGKNLIPYFQANKVLMRKFNKSKRARKKIILVTS